MSLRWIEDIAGAALMLAVLADVFLTVLYARIGTGIISDHVAKATALLFKTGADRCGRARGRVLSFCGPTILVLILFVWTFGLACGSALLIHPDLGTSVVATNERTPTDFISALYAGGNSVAVVGANNFVPMTGPFRMLFLFNSIVGTSVVSLTLTYLLQIYSALRERNTLALKLHILTRQTGDAAELIAGLGPEGDFNGGYMIITELAAEITKVKEAHQFYPVLFYFRFRQPYYSVSRTTRVALDLVALIKSGLDDEPYRWLKKSASVSHIGDSSLLMVKILENAFLPGGEPRHPRPPGDRRAARWREHYFAALDRMAEAGIPVIEDREAGAKQYVELRGEWEPYVKKLGRSGAYQMDEVDPSTPGQ